MNEGIIGSMKELGITESYKLKRQVVLSASEAAEMILRYDLHTRAQETHSECILGWMTSSVRRHGGERLYNMLKSSIILIAMHMILDREEIMITRQLIRQLEIVKYTSRCALPFVLSTIVQSGLRCPR